MQTNSSQREYGTQNTLNAVPHYSRAHSQWKGTLGADSLQLTLAHDVFFRRLLSDAMDFLCEVWEVSQKQGMVMTLLGWANLDLPEAVAVQLPAMKMSRKEHHLLETHVQHAKQCKEYPMIAHTC